VTNGSAPIQNKYAVLSMDVEEWYNLLYYQDKRVNKSYSMLDGFELYIELLNRHNIKTTFFVLSELADRAKDIMRYAVSCGHEIACHGKTHTRPIDMGLEQYKSELSEAKNRLEDVTGLEIKGYRAPCYGIDNKRYDIVRDTGFIYSSSKMDVPHHPLYGELDVTGFDQPMRGIYTRDNMTEFALSTHKYYGKHIAVSGGGWIRIFPWKIFMKPLINEYIEQSNTYFLYIHPFELSAKKMPAVPNTGPLTYLRAHLGLGEVAERIEELIKILEENNFKFYTFNELRDEIAAVSSPVVTNPNKTGQETAI
jgi:Predicted xylanase/chitin deacetylase